MSHKPALNAIQQAMNRSKLRLEQHMAAARDKAIEREKRHLQGLMEAATFILKAANGAEAPETGKGIAGQGEGPKNAA